MRVLIGVHHFPPTYHAGAELRAFRTAQNLQKRGHEVRVICVENVEYGDAPGITSQDSLYEGIPVTRLFFNHHLYPDPERFEYDNLWIGAEMRHIISQFQPHLFHLFSGYLLSGRAILAAVETRVPVCLSLTDFWFLCKHIQLMSPRGEICPIPPTSFHCLRCERERKRRYAILGRLFPGLMDWFWYQQSLRVQGFARRQSFLMEVLGKVDRIISPSQFLRSVFIQTGIPEGQIVYRRQGRDFPDLTREKLEKIPSTQLRLGYTGQIAPHKGVHLIGEALQMLSGLPLEVFVYGNINAPPRYVARIKKMAAQDSRFRYMGEFSTETPLWKIYQNIDVQVVPSIWYENSPNVILEAFAHRTPVITSNHGGMAEMVRNGVDGLHFERGNSKSLAQCILRLNEDREFLRRLEAGIPPVKSTRQEVDELIEIYQEILDHYPAHRAGE